MTRVMIHGADTPVAQKVHSKKKMEKLVQPVFRARVDGELVNLVGPT